MHGTMSHEANNSASTAASHYIASYSTVEASDQDISAPFHFPLATRARGNAATSHHTRPSRSANSNDVKGEQAGSNLSSASPRASPPTNGFKLRFSNVQEARTALASARVPVSDATIPPNDFGKAQWVRRIIASMRNMKGENESASNQLWAKSLKTKEELIEIRAWELLVFLCTNLLRLANVA